VRDKWHPHRGFTGVHPVIVDGINKPAHARAHRAMEPIPEEHTAGVADQHLPH
jgi:hypothetical protein